MKQKVIIFCVLILLASGFAGTFLMLCSLPRQAHASGSGDWPMFQGDLARTGTNLSESSITATTAANLHYSWGFTVSGYYFAASPAIVGGVMYEGSWNGNEYAVDVSTHQQIWKQNLGVTVQNKHCYANSVGVTSSAAVQNSVVYVGGGDGYMYALNAASGAVIWKTLLGLPPYYNFSSPVVYNNKVYIGLAAFCDPPFVQGQVLALNTSDGSVAASISLVPKGQTGAPVWGSPSVDAGTNTIFVATGNNGSQTIGQQPLSEAIVALDANTLAVKDHWQIPPAQQVPDSDFGTTPVLFDLNGIHYIGALNKNGIYYVWDRTNLAAGPIWEQVMSGNSQLVQGDNVSPSCYNNGVIYAGSAGGTINGTSYGGSVRAFDASTGHILWSANTVGYMVAPITCTNGLVVDDQGNVVEVRDASNGKILFRHATLKRIFGASVISNGALYTPSTDGSIYVFTLKNAPTPTSTPTAGNTFQDNFDSYAPGPLPTGTGTNQWTTVNVTGTGFAVNVSTVQAKSAPNALQFTMGSGLKGHAWASKKYNSGFPTHAAEFSLFLDPGLTYNTQAISLLTARNSGSPTNGSASVWLSVGRRLQVIWYDSTAKKHVLSTLSQLASGQWYKIELDQTNDPVNGSWSLWLNGSQIAGQTSSDTGNTQVNACTAGDMLPSTSAMSGSFYEDDIVTATQHIG